MDGWIDEAYTTHTTPLPAYVLPVQTLAALYEGIRVLCEQGRSSSIGETK